MWQRCKQAGENAWKRFKLSYVWRHRTKNIGMLGIGAGAAKNYLVDHHIWHVSPHFEGLLLAFFGAIVTAVGVYNTFKEKFGWSDDDPTVT